MSNLHKYYEQYVVPKLKQDLKIKNVMRVPRVTKVTLNMGLGKGILDKKIISDAVKEMSLIAGQLAVITKAKKSIAGFKLRKDWPIGCKVTLRKQKMYDFLERLLNIAIPRIRDFRGLNKHSFDEQGNYSMGIKEQIVFPEIQYDKISALRGMDIIITTTAANKEEGLALLKLLNFPIR